MLENLVGERERERLIALHKQTSESLVSVNGQLEEYKNFGTVRGKSVGRDQFIRINDCRAHLLRTLKETEGRLGRIKRQIAQENGGRGGGDLFRRFFEAASECLPNEVFARVMQVATQSQD